MPTVITQGAASAKGYGFGARSTAATFVEDVFSTYLFTGNGGAQTITNGIDLSGKGGLVWYKKRSAVGDNRLYDTARGPKELVSNSTVAQVDWTGYWQFNADGFSFLQAGLGNDNGSTLASWTFREQPKFFDVVTYTGNGSNRTIAHNLGSVPGCIMIKRTDTIASWVVYHRSLANTQYMVLNTTAAAATGATYWNSTTPTSSVFSLGTSTDVNASGGTYVAYLFAHDAGGFGATGTDNVISCGTFTTNASGVATVTLGYEPQWILTKRTNAASPWLMRDNMRGWTAPSGAAQNLRANLANAEDTTDPSGLYPTATGFSVDSAWVGATAAPFIYIAIRRGPMKTPTTGTSVFSPIARTGTGANTTITSNFVTDSVISVVRTSGQSAWWDRLRGQLVWSALNGEGAEITDPNALTSFANMTGVNLGLDSSYGRINVASTTYANWMFRRAPGFFDVVCYTGTGANRTVSHNLGVAPELMIVKRRDSFNAWAVYANNDNTDYLVLDTDAATADNITYWNDTSPTSSVFTVGTNNAVNASTSNYVAYLFATVAGVSKVGSYTGTGTTNQINCGFTGGARFVLIKRVNSTGNWYVWDSARGIVAGNDPYFLIDTSNAEVTSTDYVDTYSAGFELSSTAPAAINANGGTFIFLAIA